MAHSPEEQPSAGAMSDLGILVLMPTFNNARTLEGVIFRTLEVIGESQNPISLLVVNDGSTDNTSGILQSFSEELFKIHFETNQGKGAALKAGFEFARENGYRHVITIDSDGQHFPEDIPLFIEKIKTCPDSLIMGARGMKQGGAPRKSSFGNKFSNFWYYVETGLRLPDTQTGFRCYPLEGLKKVKLLTNKFELEVEVIVKLAWAGVVVHSLPVRVKYEFSERVSHFRPFWDFTRISILNTYLVTRTFFWYLPKRLLKKNIFEIIWKEVKRSDESPLRKAVAIGMGVFFGILPIWGFQLLTGIPFAIATRLNKALFIAASHISIPPFIPFIVFASYAMGELVLDTREVALPPLSELTLENIHDNLLVYTWGAIVLATVAGLCTMLISWYLISVGKKGKYRKGR